MIDALLSDRFGRLVQGQGNYVADSRLPAALYVAMVRSPRVESTPILEGRLQPVLAHVGGMCGSLAWKDVGPVTVVGEFVMPQPTFGFGAHVAVVSVEADTGRVRLERLAVGYDCGHALDRAAVMDQIVGAAVMGIGGALYERSVFDENTNPISATFADYLVPRAADVPPIEVMITEWAAPENPLGVRGE